MVRRRPPGGAADLGGVDRRLDLGRDGVGDLVLQREDVFQRPIEPLCPDRHIVDGVGELDGDPHALAGAPDASVQKVANAERAGDLARALT